MDESGEREMIQSGERNDASMNHNSSYNIYVFIIYAYEIYAQNMLPFNILCLKSKYF